MRSKAILINFLIIDSLLLSMDYDGSAGDWLHLSVIENNVLAIRVLPPDLDPISIRD
ncbi:MAG: hypothetical protein WA996_13680 [Candidatus Promineifilaceae bacterium]